MRVRQKRVEMKNLHLSIGESALLSQPSSFSKKKNYEFHEVLGKGTFGKVIVSRSLHWPLITSSSSLIIIMLARDVARTALASSHCRPWS